VPGYRALSPAPSFDSLLAEGYRSSPLLRANGEEVNARAAEISAADAFPAPVLGAEVASRTMGTHEGMERRPVAGLVAKQVIPFPGMRSLQKQVKEATLESARFAETTERLNWELLVRQQVVALWLTQRRLDVNFDHRLLLDQAVAAARKRYEVGMGSLGDILQAQNDVSELASEALTLQAEHRTLEAQINATLGCDPNRRYGPVTEGMDEDPPLPPFDSLVAWAMRARPEIQSWQFAEQASEKESAMARRSLYPDFMLEAKWMAMEGPDEFGAMVGISLPFVPWASGSARSKAAQSQAEAKRAQYQRKELEGQIRAELRSAVATIEAARAKKELAETATLPQARQALRSLESAYGSGQAEFMGLLDATHRVHRAHAAFDEARAELRNGWFALERAVGRSLQAMPPRAEMPVKQVKQVKQVNAAEQNSGSPAGTSTEIEDDQNRGQR
jgi:outer membrane protein TolC